MAKPVSPVIPGYDQFEVIYAKNQPQYGQLPALLTSETKGTYLTRWELTDEEVAAIISSKSVYLFISTFGNPLQPVLIAATINVKEQDAIESRETIDSTHNDHRNGS